MFIFRYVLISMLFMIDVLKLKKKELWETEAMTNGFDTRQSFVPRNKAIINNITF